MSRRSPKPPTLDSETPKVSNLIRRIAAEQARPGPVTYQDLGMLFSRQDLGGLMLFGDTSDSFRRTLDGLYRAVRDQYPVSKQRVEHELQTAILVTLDLAKKSSETFDARLDATLHQLVENLTRVPQQWDVDLEIGGIESPIKTEISIGNVYFYSISESSVPTYIAELWKREPRKPELLLNKGALIGRTYGRITVDAVDKDFAILAAREKLSVVLGAINFFVNILFPQHSGAYLIGEDVSQRTATFYGLAGQEAQKAVQHSWKGRLVPLQLSLFDVSKPSVRLVSDLLNASHRNEIQARVLRAIQWCGHASVARKREEALLFSMIGLESLLERESRGLASRSLALKVAHLLGTSPKEAEQIYKDVIDLYALRSTVVHQGSRDIAETDVDRARRYAKSCAMAFLLRPGLSQLREGHEFEAWFVKRILNVQREQTTLPQGSSP